MGASPAILVGAAITTLKSAELSMKMQSAVQFDSAQVRMLRMLLGIFGLVWLIDAAFQAVAWLAVPGDRKSVV